MAQGIAEVLGAPLVHGVAFVLAALSELGRGIILIVLDIEECLHKIVLF